MLLDRLLAEAGVPPTSVAGPEAGSHLEVIVLSADALPAAEPLIAAPRHSAVRSSVHALGGYDLLNSGTVRLLG